MSGNESSATGTRCNGDADIWRIQGGAGLFTDTGMDWLRTRMWSWTARGCGLDADTARTRTDHGYVCGLGPGIVVDWLRTRLGRGHWLFSDWTRARAGQGHGRLAAL